MNWSNDEIEYRVIQLNHNVQVHRKHIEDTTHINDQKLSSLCLFYFLFLFF